MPCTPSHSHPPPATPPAPHSRPPASWAPCTPPGACLAGSPGWAGRERPVQPRRQGGPPWAGRAGRRCQPPSTLHGVGKTSASRVKTTPHAAAASGLPGRLLSCGAALHRLRMGVSCCGAATGAWSGPADADLLMSAARAHASRRSRIATSGRTDAITVGSACRSPTWCALVHRVDAQIKVVGQSFLKPCCFDGDSRVA